MGAHWLWALPCLPALTGGLLLLGSGRARPLAGPLVIVVNAAALALAVWAWLERPSVELAWLPLGDEMLPLRLSAAAGLQWSLPRSADPHWRSLHSGAFSGKLQDAV